MNDSIVGGVVTYRLTADPSELYSGLDAASRKVSDFTGGLNSIGNSAEKGFDSASKSALAFADNVSNAMTAVLDSVTSLGHQLTSVFNSISGIELPVPNMDYITGSLTNGMNMSALIEGATKGIALMTHSEEEAARIMERIVKEATKTTFNVGNLLQYTQQLGAAAHGDFEGALDAALAFGGAMTAAGNGLRDMGLVVRNVQQGMARGYNSIDLRQFKTYIPQFTQIMEQAGLTDEKIIAMGVDGAKAVNEAITAWVKQENIWVEYENTYTNLKESLLESIQTTTYAAAQNSGLFDALKNTIRTFKDELPVFEETFTSIGRTLAEIITKIDWVAYMKGIASGFGVIANTIKGVWAVVEKIITVVGGGDLSKGIERLLPLVTGLSIGMKGFSTSLGFIQKFKFVFDGKDGLKGGIESVQNAISKVTGKGNKGGTALGSLTQLAISLAAFAAALYLINKVDLDYGTLLPKLITLGAVVLEMEVLARAATKIKVNKAQVKNLIMLAAPLALFAADLWLIEKAVPGDLAPLIPKLGIITGCIVAMGALSIAADKLNLSLSGILAVTALALPLGTMALALSVVNTMIPNDLGMLVAKLAVVGVVMLAVMSLCILVGEPAVALIIAAGAAVFTAIGIALMAIGAGVAIAAQGIATASRAALSINLLGLFYFLEVLGVVSVVLTTISIFAGFGAVGAIASAIIGGGLLVAVVCLAEAQKHVDEINPDSFVRFSELLKVIAKAMTEILRWVALGALATIATDIIAGGLLLAATCLVKTQEAAEELKIESFEHFMEIVRFVDKAMGEIILWAALGAITTVATDIIAGGLLIAAKFLAETQKSAEVLKYESFKTLMSVIEIVDVTLGKLAGWAFIGSISSIANDVIAAGLLVAAKKLAEATEVAARIDIPNLDKLLLAVKRISEMSAGSFWNNLSKMFESSLLVKVARDVAEMANYLGNMPKVRERDVDTLISCIEKLARMDLNGGLFDSRDTTATILLNTIKSISMAMTILSLTPIREASRSAEILKEIVDGFGSGWDKEKAVAFKNYFAEIGKLTTKFSGLLTLVDFVLARDMFDFGSQLREFYEAISRDGEGWPADQAKSFASYFNEFAKLKDSSKTLGSIVKAVNGWDISTFHSKLQEFVEVVKNGDDGWNLSEAKAFTSYFNQLGKVKGDLEGVSSLIRYTLGWNVEVFKEKLDLLEQAISRDGNGYPLNWATGFVNYFNKLGKLKGDFENVDKLIQYTLRWDVDTFKEKISTLEQAISRDGNGYPLSWASGFVNYFNKLGKVKGDFEGLDQIINRTSTWNIEEFKADLSILEQAISRDGYGWSISWAQDFTKYFNQLGRVKGDFEGLDSVINYTTKWNVETFRDDLVVLETAISRNGWGWDFSIAQAFIKFFNELNKVKGDFEGLDSVVNYTSRWNVETFKSDLILLETAISRDGWGWGLDVAQSFTKFFNQLSNVKGDFEGLNSAVEYVAKWNVESFKEDLILLETAISRNGWGWRMEVVQGFNKFFNELSKVKGDFEGIDKLVNYTKNWEVETFKSNLNTLEQAISRDGWGWPMDQVTGFVKYMDKLGTLKSNLENINTIVGYVTSWDVDSFKTKIKTFAEAIANDDWAVDKAQKFVSYANKISMAKKDFEGIDNFIGLVLKWEVEKLGERLRLLREAIKGGDEGWKLSEVQNFITYINILARSKDIQVFSNFVDKVLSWDIPALGEKLQKLKEIIKGTEENGGEWNKAEAQGFKDFWSKIASIKGDFTTALSIFEAVNNMAGLEVGEGGGNSPLLDRFIEIEKIFSRNGWGWEKKIATSFADFWKELAKVKDDIGIVKGLLDYVNGMESLVVGEGGSSPLFDKFNELEKIISRSGWGWNKTLATAFINYFNELNKLSSMESVEKIVRAFSFDGSEAANPVEEGVSLFDKYNMLEKIISRDAAGWNVDFATGFINYFNKLSELDLDQSKIDAIVTAFEKIENDADLLEEIKWAYFGFGAIVHRDNAGWDEEHASGFISYFRQIKDFPNIKTAVGNVMEAFKKGENYYTTDDINQTKTLYTTMETVVSRDGWGWDETLASEFVRFWKKFAEIHSTMPTVKEIVEAFTGLNAEGMKRSVEATRQMIEGIDKTLTEKADVIKNVGKRMLQYLLDGFNDEQPKVLKDMNTKLKNMANDIKSAFPYNTFRTIGEDAIKGLADGMNNTKWRVQQSATEIGNLVAQALRDKKALDEHSPSRVMYDIGVYVGEGLALGIESTADRVREAAQSLTGAINSEFNRIDPVSVGGNLSASVNPNGSAYGNVNKTNNITLNNNIYNEMDLSVMMAGLKWEMARV